VSPLQPYVSPPATVREPLQPDVSVMRSGLQP
jgi:hypothetical protein